MGFEEQLRQNTKPATALHNEQKTEQEKRIRYMAQIFVRAFSMACQGAAAAGKRSLKMGIPLHLVSKLYVHGGSMRYADNESYIAHCYNCALQSSSCSKYGFFSPCQLQSFNVENKSCSINNYYSYPKSYADSLVVALKDELKKNDFTKAKVVYKTGNDVVERHFFKERKVHKPFIEHGVKYFYMGIETEW